MVGTSQSWGDGSRRDDDIDAGVVLFLSGQPVMPVVLELCDRYGRTLASQVELEG
jgi:hypothetical protein